ncbi:deoxyguanosinetriphosphate triphosphohydrolase [Terrabacter sp. MAHUQ-38]|uniref:deoxyguanosinetriphosphate triphosphohydrolase n=1 Tax=unclassified Terrabacter TaxID=2630222 RepID=UPI00165E9B05|nr:deoxyguanosinetriphosphate triphosphohydrolase [Terrabacter sp. MAHUQ-38]
MGYEGRDRERWVAEDPAQKRADRDDFARDRARVVHSSALRRLAAKTQVLAPGHDDFVRNRLTHSLEVAQIGREFGAALGCNADVVDTACLSHDLGHPPFGHNGETALDEIASGIGGFEGNAQTLRLLTRLEAKRSHVDGTPAGLNLTRASLDATTKYPWARGHGPYGTPKFGLYPSDLPVFDWIREGAAPRRRCLEAEVMDWSDDVAYSVHDVEDAIASGWIDPRVLHSRDLADVIAVASQSYAPDLGPDALGAALERIIASGVVPTAYDGSRSDLARLKDMTSRLIGHFVLVVEQATRARHGPGELCRFEADLVVPDDTRAECTALKAIANHFVMTTDERLTVMSEQRDVVRALVEAYAARPEERLDVAFRVDHASAVDDGERLRVVVDQVASLTDVRALALHRQWCR